VDRFIVMSEDGGRAWGATNLRSRGWVEPQFAYVYAEADALAVAEVEGGVVRPLG